ncbi:hypothetical protein AAVH_12892 [Aphelenchoides avenae]|nr:hypothetical protein AAVH_12892 [Aphelenchus avenae]
MIIVAVPHAGIAPIYTLLKSEMYMMWMFFSILAGFIVAILATSSEAYFNGANNGRYIPYGPYGIGESRLGYGFGNYDPRFSASRLNPNYEYLKGGYSRNVNPGSRVRTYPSSNGRGYFGKRSVDTSA